MSIQSLKLPSEAQMLTFLRAHPFSKDEDAEEVAQTFAKAFACENMPSSEKIFDTAKPLNIACMFDLAPLLVGIKGALEDCAIANRYQKLPEEGGQIDLPLLKQLRADWIKEESAKGNRNLAMAAAAVAVIAIASVAFQRYSH